MRTPYNLAAFALAFGVAGAALGQEPINPYGPTTTTTTTTTTTQAPPPPTVLPPPTVPPPDAQPINPYGHGYGWGQGGYYPPPSQYGYQPPTPGRYHSTPPNYQQGYYLYAAPGQPPVYYAPPPSYGARYQLNCAAMCGGTVARPARKWDGVHRTVMGINQKVGADNVVLAGAGFQLRLRSKGRFGFEARQSFLRAEYWNGGFVRNSYPFTLSLMFYIFPNDDKRHFNLYGLAGVGAMADTVRVRFQPGEYREQDFLEWEAHLGLGAELRFKWFAIEADVRGAGLWRDNRDRPATYYNNVAGGPIPENSYGISGNLYVSLWF